MPFRHIRDNRLDYRRNGSVLLTMENSNHPDPNLTAAHDMLAALSEELDAMVGVIASLDGPRRLAEILNHSVKAMALTKASQTLLARVA